MACILAIDDEAGLLAGLKFPLEAHELLTAANGRTGLALLEARSDIDLVLLDMKMPADLAGRDEDEGLAVLAAIRRQRPHVPVIIMSSFRETDLVVEAMKAGANHYLTKPLELGRLREEIAKALSLGGRSSATSPAVAPPTPAPRVRRAPAAPPMEGEDGAERFGRLVGRSAAMQELYRGARAAAASASSAVLIQGETGTGKELLARAIHDHSPRAKGPWIAVNTAAMPDHLVESEVFGHRKGAFTGAMDDHAGFLEQAHGGTLFLDEIGDMPLALQAKLLRALQEFEVRRVGDSHANTRRVDIRVISATHRSLRAMIDQGTFRSDLFYRLRVFELRIPPLRERLDDLPLLCRHLLARHDRPPALPTDDALAVLAAHPWPGNVRELESVLRQCAEMGDDRIDAAAVRRALANEATHAPPAPARAMPSTTAPSPTMPATPPAHDELLARVQRGELRVGDPKAFENAHGREALVHILRWAVDNSPTHRKAMDRIGYAGSEDAFRQRVRRYGLAG